MCVCVLTTWKGHLGLRMSHFFKHSVLFPVVKFYVYFVYHSSPPDGEEVTCQLVILGRVLQKFYKKNKLLGFADGFISPIGVDSVLENSWHVPYWFHATHTQFFSSVRTILTKSLYTSNLTRHIWNFRVTQLLIYWCLYLSHKDFPEYCFKIILQLSLGLEQHKTTWKASASTTVVFFTWTRITLKGEWLWA